MWSDSLKKVSSSIYISWRILRTEYDFIEKDCGILIDFEASVKNPLKKEIKNEDIYDNDLKYWADNMGQNGNASVESKPSLFDILQFTS